VADSDGANGGLTRATAAGRPGARASIAVAVVAAWAAAALVSRRVGLWPAMGTAALALGALSLALDRRLRGAVRASATAAVAGVLAGIAMAAACWLIYPLLARFEPWAVGDKLGLDTAFAALSPARAALLLPLVIAGEEMAWREVVQGRLAAWLGPAPAVVAGAALYAAATGLSGSPVLALTALAGGLLWSALRQLTGDLTAPILCHLVWAVLVLFLRPVLP